MQRRLLAVSLIANLVLLMALGWSARHRIQSDIRSLTRQHETAPLGGVRLSVDLGADNHPISPYIYGVSSWDAADTAGLHAALARWGGNPSTRYNWVGGDYWNAAGDWNFINKTYVNEGGSAADRWVAYNRSHDTASLVTIPAMGWVAKSKDNRDASIGVPPTGGVAINASGAIRGYDPTANRLRTSVPSLPAKPGPFVIDPDPSSQPVYQDEWVNHLKAKFGAADHGGVRYFAIDNEPMGWSSVHRDVHPAHLGYDGLAQTYLSYARALKAVDSSAQVLGPDASGWIDLNYSALDEGTDNFGTQADRKAHGDVPLTQWFLRTVHAADVADGKRSLDLLDTHWYPQQTGVYSDQSSPELDRLRIRSTRALWDPSYTDESWIGKPVALIPLLKSWIAREYPGTRLAVSEYSFGGGRSASAAVAEAEALGVFGREGVEVASYWFGPQKSEPAGFAIRMFRDADGNGSGFGATSVRGASSAPNAVSVFGSKDAKGAEIMLINKQLDRAQSVVLTVSGGSGSPAQRYQYTASDLQRISPAPPLSSTGGSYGLELPAGSITLLRIPA